MNRMQKEKGDGNRIVFIVNSSEIGGGNKSLELLTRGIQKYIDPCFICPSNGPMVTLVKSLGFDCHVVSTGQPDWKKPFKTLENLGRWIRLLKRINPVLIHANGLYGARSAVMAAAILNIPLISHIRFIEDKKTCQWMFRYLPKPVGFIYVSEYIKNCVDPGLKDSCPAASGWVVHNGVDTDLFCPVPHDNSVLRVGIVANFQTVKGHEDFFRMARILNQHQVCLQYDVFGQNVVSGLDRNMFLKDFVRKLRIDHQVHFHGHVQNIAREMKKLDILVCSSHIEPFGRCIIEGMACGLPVVATRVGGIPEIMVEGETGLMVPASDPQALAAAVMTLVKHPSLGRQMGEKGRKRVQEHFSTQKHCRRILDIYCKVLPSTCDFAAGSD